MTKATDTLQVKISSLPSGLISATNIDLISLPEYTMPEQIRDEIPTLSRFGYMKLDLDDFSKKFIQNITASNKIGLEIGCAYGLCVAEALSQGAKIIASDVSFEHLCYLLKKTTLEQRQNLSLYQAEFPKEIDLESESIGAILISRVLHFQDGPTIELGLNKMHKWLEPNGRLYITLVTPHHSSFRDKFLSTYQERAAKGIKYPGEITEHWTMSPQHEPFVPKYLNVFDIPELEALMLQHGFEIEDIRLFDYPNDDQSEGKGHVGVIARKV